MVFCLDDVVCHSQLKRKNSLCSFCTRYRLVNRCYCNRTYVFIQLFYLMRSGMGYIISQLQIESCYCSKNKQNFVSEKVGFLVAPPRKKVQTINGTCTCTCK